MIRSPLCVVILASFAAVVQGVAAERQAGFSGGSPKEVLTTLRSEHPRLQLTANRVAAIRKLAIHLRDINDLKLAVEFVPGG
jgi:hypothetical protein